MKVNVPKDELIAALLANREQHRAAFENAMDGYQAECIRILEQNIEQYRNGRVKKQLYLHEQLPVDHTRDYDTVIGLMKFSVGDVVELSPSEYRQYVLDDWEWKVQWAASTAKYTGAEE